MASGYGGRSRLLRLPHRYGRRWRSAPSLAILSIRGDGLLGLYLIGRTEERERAEGSDAARRLSELGVRLQGIATERGLTTDDVRARVQGTWRVDDVEQYMAGKSLPDWSFVQEFAKVDAHAAITGLLLPDWQGHGRIKQRPSSFPA
jgi:hypothetical protein